MTNKYNNPNTHLKTEKIAENVNQYVLMQEEFRHKLEDIMEEVSNKHYARIINEDSWAKVQLVSGSSELYELFYDNQRKKQRLAQEAPLLKLIIKSFMGKTLHLSFSTRSQKVKLQQCQYKISGQKIIKVRNPILRKNKIYLTVHSPEQLTICKMKYQFASQEEQDRKSRFKSSSLQLIRIKPNQENSKDKEEKHQILLNFKKLGLASPKSQRSIIFDRSRLESARVESIQKQKQRLLQAREKKAHIETYKEKSKSLLNLSYHCVGLLGEYKEQVRKQNGQRKQLVKCLAILVNAILFIDDVHHQAQEREENLMKALRGTRFQRKCAKQMKRIVNQLKIIQPNRIFRQLLTVYHHSTCIAKTFLAKDSQSAKQIILTCFQKTIISISLNKASEHAANYRTKIRTIQKYWKNRNYAQISMFKQCTLQRMDKLIKKQRYFDLVKSPFLERNMPFNLSWQYLKDSNLRLKGLFKDYDLKLKQIEDIKHMNSQIKHYNSKSLKKYHKKFLTVPDPPCRPLQRYFRDLDILKSMVRSWFEIEYSCQVKKMKKDWKGKSTPKNIKM